MDADIDLLIDVTRKASRFLYRDYLELENLQASGKNTESFCNKSALKCIDTVSLALSKYYKTIIFSNEDAKKLDFSGSIALVEVLDGARNLQRALPFFGLMITILSKKDDNIAAEKCIINFPALNEIYYTQRGKGAWLEKHSSNLSGVVRIRVSGVNKTEDMVISAKPDLLEMVKDLSTNIRCFDSYLYSWVLLCSGKIDMCISSKRDISIHGLELIIVESGGKSFVKNDLLIASNYQLSDKINQLIN